MSEMQDMTTIVRLGAEGTYFLLKGSAKLTMYLYQKYKQMEKAKILKHTEVAAFEDFIKATEGKFQLLNIPTEDAGLLGQMKRDFGAMGVNYTILPDLSVGDGITTIAYPMAHTPQVENWYRAFCISQLCGGEQSYEKLERLTEGQLTIVNIPWKEDFLPEDRALEKEPAEAIERKETGKALSAEEKLQKASEKAQKRMKETMAEKAQSLRRLREDLTRLRINYALLPDLHVGDGFIQVAFANMDAKKMEAWYEGFRESLLRRPGEETQALPRDMETMSVSDYMGTGKNDAKRYDAAIPKEYKNILKETIPPGEAPAAGYDPEIGLRQINAVAKARPVGCPAYEEALQTPGITTFTIDQGNLLPGQDSGGNYIVRLPGTQGKEYLAVPPGELYVLGNGRTYVAALRPGCAYPVVDRTGGLLEKRLPREIKKHWEKADPKQFLKTASKTIGKVPKAGKRPML